MAGSVLPRRDGGPVVVAVLMRVPVPVLVPVPGSGRAAPLRVSCWGAVGAVRRREPAARCRWRDAPLPPRAAGPGTRGSPPAGGRTPWPSRESCCLHWGMPRLSAPVCRGVTGRGFLHSRYRAGRARRGCRACSSPHPSPVLVGTKGGYRELFLGVNANTPHVPGAGGSFAAVNEAAGRGSCWSRVMRRCLGQPLP